jgi:lipopolysaccharide/colanic/teichoic acid biosynthesis glycosyltransferase
VVVLALIEGGAIFAGLCGAMWSHLYDLRAVGGFREFVSRLPRAGVATGLLLAALSPLLSTVPSLAWALLGTFGLLLSIRVVGYAIMGSRFLRERVPAVPGLRYRVLGPLEHLGEIVEHVRPHRVIEALSERRGRFPVDVLLAWRVRGFIVEQGADAYERLTGKLALEALTLSSFVFSRRCRRPLVALAAGRAFSVAASALGLVGLAPLLVLIAAAIKLDSSGPVLFVQERVGVGGRRFGMIKFRTMRPAMYATSEWAGDNGDRITRVGWWLRRFRLDELPQLVNVLRGDMNLVGPRPHPVCSAELFLREIPYYALRLTVRPGLTGWAQVRYRYANHLQEEIEKTRYDLYYIKHKSPWLDLRILFETVEVVLSGRGVDVLTSPPRAEARQSSRPGPGDRNGGAGEGRPAPVPAGSDWAGHRGLPAGSTTGHHRS